MSSKYLIAALVVAISIPCLASGDRGFVEGHLSILPSREVELADAKNIPAASVDYAQYPLVVLSRDGKREIARLAVEANGNYRAELAPGDYMLDVQDRAEKHLRGRPQAFTIVSNQTVRVDMDIDTGIR
jgi:hypothetical protein